MKNEVSEFYYLDHTDWSVNGPFSTEQAAREEAQQDCSHTTTLSIMKVVAKSSPPPLVRKWKAA